MVFQGPFVFTTIINLIQIGNMVMFFYVYSKNADNNYFTNYTEMNIDSLESTKMIDVRPIAQMFIFNLRCKALVVGLLILRIVYYLLTKILRSFVHKHLIQKILSKNLKYFFAVLAVLIAISRIYIIVLGDKNVYLTQQNSSIVATF